MSFLLSDCYAQVAGSPHTGMGHSKFAVMSAASTTPVSVFATVAFLKIHEFGRRPVVEQARLRAQLEAAIAVALAGVPERSRIVLDAADGIALALLADPRVALELAERTLAAGSAGLPVSAGLTHGAVRATGNGAGEGLMGDGIAVAAAVAGLAGASKMLMTREYRYALADAVPGAEALLVKAGTHTDASLRSHQLYRPDPRAPGARGRRYLLAGIALSIALLGAGIAYRASIVGPQALLDRVTATFQAGVEGARKLLER